VWKNAFTTGYLKESSSIFVHISYGEFSPEEGILKISQSEEEKRELSGS
jgi:hypothetical protein